MIPTQTVEKIAESQVINARYNGLGPRPVKSQPGMQSNAKLSRCEDCQVWWGSSDEVDAADNRIFKMAEPHTESFLFQDYRGWQGTTQADICPECGAETAGPAFALSS